jgi:hypothetical protein
MKTNLPIPILHTQLPQSLFDATNPNNPPLFRFREVSGYGKVRSYIEGGFKQMAENQKKAGKQRREFV